MVFAGLYGLDPASLRSLGFWVYNPLTLCGTPSEQNAPLAALAVAQVALGVPRAGWIFRKSLFLIFTLGIKLKLVMQLMGAYVRTGTCNAQ